MIKIEIKASISTFIYTSCQVLVTVSMASAVMVTIATVGNHIETDQPRKRISDAPYHISNNNYYYGGYYGIKQ